MKTTTSSSLVLSFAAVYGLLAVTPSLVPSAAQAQTDVPVVVPAAVPGGVRVVAPAGSATVANAQVVSANGVVDVYEAGTPTFVVRETTGPVTYTYGPQVVYATPGGVVLTAEQVRTRMRAGLPVRVEYVTQGETRVVRRVVVEER